MSTVLQPRLRMIWFDAVGTLLTPAEPVAETYARAGRAVGAHLSADEIASRFRAAFQRQEEIDRQHDWRTDEDRERRRWLSIVAEVFRDQSDPQAPFPELWQHYAEPSAWRCYPDVAGCLAQLRERGLPFGIASNLDHRLRRICAGLPELQGCGALLISSEVGWRKPAAAFFHAAASLLHSPRRGEGPGVRGDLLHIGDDPRNDRDGARAAGWRSAWLVRAPEHDDDADLTTLEQLSNRYLTTDGK